MRWAEIYFCLEENITAVRHMCSLATTHWKSTQTIENPTS